MHRFFEKDAVGIINNAQPFFSLILLSKFISCKKIAMILFSKVIIVSRPVSFPFEKMLPWFTIQQKNCDIFWKWIRLSCKVFFLHWIAKQNNHLKQEEYYKM